MQCISVIKWYKAYQSNTYALKAISNLKGKHLSLLVNGKNIYCLYAIFPHFVYSLSFIILLFGFFFPMKLFMYSTIYLAKNPKETFDSL